MAVIIFSGSRRSYDSHLKDLKYVFSLQFPKLKWFSKPIYYHDSTVEVKNNLARVNISRTIYYEDGNFFENSLCKIQVALPLCLNDQDSSDVLGASSANFHGLFHSRKLVLKLIFNDNERDWFEFQVGYQPQRISFSYQNAYPQSVFKSS